LRRLHDSSRIIEALSMVVQGTKTEWGNVHKLLSSPNSLLNTLQHFDIKEITEDTFMKVKEIVKDPRIDRSALIQSSNILKMAIEWLEGLVDYRTSHKHSSPDPIQPPSVNKPQLRFATTQQINELRVVTNPTAKIKKTLDAVCLLLGEKPDWNVARRLMSIPQKFIDTLNRLNFESVPTMSIEKIKRYLDDPDSDFSKIKIFSHITADLALFVRQSVAYWETIRAYKISILK
jgi:hypothetical protein